MAQLPHTAQFGITYPILISTAKLTTKLHPRHLLTTLLAHSVQSEPTTVNEVLSQPCWMAMMNKELQTLHLNSTCMNVQRTLGMNVVGCRWIYQTKYNASGTLEWYKAQLVAKGFHQIEGND